VAAGSDHHRVAELAAVASSRHRDSTPTRLNMTQS
jgi:hypothetical protein